MFDLTRTTNNSSITLDFDSNDIDVDEGASMHLVSMSMGDTGSNINSNDVVTVPAILTPVPHNKRGAQTPPRHNDENNDPMDTMPRWP
jgi:hypothetical protein